MHMHMHTCDAHKYTPGHTRVNTCQRIYTYTDTCTHTTTSKRHVDMSIHHVLTSETHVHKCL